MSVHGESECLEQTSGGLLATANRLRVKATEPVSLLESL